MLVYPDLGFQEKSLPRVIGMGDYIELPVQCTVAGSPRCSMLLVDKAAKEDPALLLTSATPIRVTKHTGKASTSCTNQSVCPGTIIMAPYHAATTPRDLMGAPEDEVRQGGQPTMALSHMKGGQPIHNCMPAKTFMQSASAMSVPSTSTCVHAYIDSDSDSDTEHAPRLPVTQTRTNVLDELLNQTLRIDRTNTTLRKVLAYKQQAIDAELYHTNKRAWRAKSETWDGIQHAATWEPHLATASWVHLLTLAERGLNHIIGHSPHAQTASCRSSGGPLPAVRSTYIPPSTLGGHVAAEPTTK